jgi:hypothetical protein
MGQGDEVHRTGPRSDAHDRLALGHAPMPKSKEAGDRHVPGETVFPRRQANGHGYTQTQSPAGRHVPRDRDFRRGPQLDPLTVGAQPTVAQGKGTLAPGPPRGPTRVLDDHDHRRRLPRPDIQERRDDVPSPVPALLPLRLKSKPKRRLPQKAPHRQGQASQDDPGHTGRCPVP